jgi:hypothetical protein
MLGGAPRAHEFLPGRSSQRTQHYGIWSVRVNEKSGEPEGKPLQLTKGVGRIGGLSVTADSKRLVVWRANIQPQVFLTEIDPETYGFKTPRRLTLDKNVNIVAAWTPDGRYRLYVSALNINILVILFLAMYF